MASPAIVDQLEDLRDTLDRQIAELRLGPLTPRRYEVLEEQAQEGATRWIAAYRGQGRAQCPPMGQSKSGGYYW